MTGAASNQVRWHLPDPYVIDVSVLDSHIDRMGHVNNSAYLPWLEQAAWGHSTQLGLSWPLYQQLDTAMVARETTLTYRAPAFKNDLLWVATWITENDEKRSIRRQYQIIRASDHKCILTATTQWVCVQLSTGKLRRMPEAFINGYRLGGTVST